MHAVVDFLCTSVAQGKQYVFAYLGVFSIYMFSNFLYVYVFALFPFVVISPMEQTVNAISISYKFRSHFGSSSLGAFIRILSLGTIELEWSYLLSLWTGSLITRVRLCEIITLSLL